MDYLLSECMNRKPYDNYLLRIKLTWLQRKKKRKINQIKKLFCASSGEFEPPTETIKFETSDAVYPPAQVMDKIESGR